MKFVAVALLGTAAATTAKKSTNVPCITGLTVYSDVACKTAIDLTKDAKAKKYVDKKLKEKAAKCTEDKKDGKGTTMKAADAKLLTPGKCIKLGTAIDKIKSKMYMNTKKGASYMTAGAAAVLAFAATQF